HVWLFHSIEKLPRISRETFDITALSFGIKSVESQRGLPRTAQTGNDNQFSSWNFHIEVLEVVLSSTANLDNFRRHFDQKRRTFQLTTTVLFLQLNCVAVGGTRRFPWMQRFGPRLHT